MPLCFTNVSPLTYLGDYEKIVRNIQNVPAKLLLAKLLAANALAAYNGYASTRNVKTPLKTSRVLPSG